MSRKKTYVFPVQNSRVNRREFLAGTTVAALSVYATGLEAAPKTSAVPAKKGVSAGKLKCGVDHFLRGHTSLTPKIIIRPAQSDLVIVRLTAIIDLHLVLPVVFAFGFSANGDRGHA